MSNASILRLSALFLCLMLGFSCVENVEIDSKEERPIVVDCVLKAGNLQTLRLYRLRKLYHEEYEEIEGAAVELLKLSGDGDNYTKVAEFLHKDGPDWEASYTPEYEAEYMLRVYVHHKEVIHAYTKFPSDFQLMMHLSQIINDKGELMKAVSGEVSERKRVFYYKLGLDTLYYHNPDSPLFDVYESSTKACKMWIYPHVDSTIVMKPNNMYSVYDQCKVRYSGTTKPIVKYAVTDHPGADNFNIVRGSIKDMFFFKVPINSYYDDWWAPDYNPLNLSQWCLDVYPDLPLHDSFIRIDHPKGYNNGSWGKDLDEGYQFSSHSFFIFGEYDNYLAAIEPFVIEVRFLSDEYDCFMKDLYLKKQSRDDFILSTYDRSNIYTNIEGGLGIFGAELITWAQAAYRFNYPYGYPYPGKI